MSFPHAAQAQVRCDRGPSWVSRPVADFAARLAVNRAGLGGRSAASGVAARARATAWLPRVSASVSRGVGVSASANSGLLSTERAAESDAISFTIGMVFELDRAAWSPLELDAERAELQRTERRRSVEREVIEQLVTLELARTRPDGCAPDGTVREVVPALVRARVSLESLTGLDADELRRRALR
jgi:hypothetical protein